MKLLNYYNNRKNINKQELDLNAILLSIYIFHLIAQLLISTLNSLLKKLRFFIGINTHMITKKYSLMLEFWWAFLKSFPTLFPNEKLERNSVLT